MCKSINLANYLKNRGGDIREVVAVEKLSCSVVVYIFFCGLKIIKRDLFSSFSIRSVDFFVK